MCLDFSGFSDLQEHFRQLGQRYLASSASHTSQLWSKKNTTCCRISARETEQNDPNLAEKKNVYSAWCKCWSFPRFVLELKLGLCHEYTHVRGAVRLFANKKSKSIHAHLCKTSKLVLVAVISQMIWIKVSHDLRINQYTCSRKNPERVKRTHLNKRHHRD